MAGHIHVVRNRKALSLMLSIYVLGFVLEMMGGCASHSLGLMSDAFHMLSDGVSQLVFWIVLTFTIWYHQPPKWLIRHRKCLSSLSEERLWRIGNSINTILLLVAALYTIITALIRWYNGETVTDPISSFVIAIIGLLINGINLLIYNAYQTNNHLKSVYAHILTDLVSSLAVIISLGVYTLYKGPFWIDSALSLLLGIWMICWSWKLFKLPYPGDGNGCGCSHGHAHH